MAGCFSFVYGAPKKNSAILPDLCYDIFDYEYIAEDVLN